MYTYTDIQEGVGQQLKPLPRAENKLKLSNLVVTWVDSLVMVLCWSLFLLACTLCGVFNCSHSFKITQGSCEPLPSTTFCHDIEWSNTSLPNVRGQSNPQCINSELNHFLPLVQTQCSNATVVFLCSVYLPYCSNTNKLGEIVVLMPCRDVCERVLGGCQWLFQNNSLSWPPHLDCQNFPTAQPCFTVPGLESVVNIPSHLLTDSSNSLYQIQHDRTTSPTAIPNTILLTAMPNTILSTAIPNTISTTSHYPLSSSMVLYTTSNDSSANYTSNIINNSKLVN